MTQPFQKSRPLTFQVVVAVAGMSAETSMDSSSRRFQSGVASVIGRRLLITDDMSSMLRP